MKFNLKLCLLIFLLKLFFYKKLFRPHLMIILDVFNFHLIIYNFDKLDLTLICFW